MLVAEKKVGRRHEHAWRANPALRSTHSMERVLKTGNAAVEPGQALDGGHVAALGLGRGHHARAHLTAIDQHRAGATVAGVAADFGAGKAEVVAQHMGESLDGISRDLGRAAVERK